MARRGRRPGPTPTDSGTHTLRQRGSESTARRTVDGSRDVDVARLMGTLPEAVYVTHMDAPVFVLPSTPDPVVLKLRDDETPDALRWPDLSDIEVRAITDGMVPMMASRLVAVLLRAGAAAVVEFDVANTEPYPVRTHEGGDR